MSGSNFSNQPAPVDDPAQLTVHGLGAVEALTQAERTRRGRWMMGWVVFLCALPVIASYFTFYVVQPRGKAYGELITPTRDLPADLAPRTLAGQAVAVESLRGQWLLIVVDGGSCVGDCEKRLFMQRQLREMLGKERDKLDKLWLISDEAPVSDSLRQALETTPAMQLLRVDGAALARWLSPAEGQALTAHLYLVDPLGRWMWRSPAQPDPTRVKKDLGLLMKANSGWDRPGR
ncbi:SCO family protein [Inhella sp.]|uniref:SCO family protein n=1 Tax=Inhella sp. TaxID=1921806 RepID=UPI0035B2D87C